MASSTRPTILILQLLAVWKFTIYGLCAAAPQEVPRHDIPKAHEHLGADHGFQTQFYPYAPSLNTSFLPIEPEGQTYMLSPSMTIDGTDLVPDALTGHRSLPLLLDTLSACTWMPCQTMRCYSGINGTSNTTMKQGDDCLGVSAVTLPSDLTKDSSTNADSTTTSDAARVACAHYLSGFVTGTLLRTGLDLAGTTVDDAQVVFADGFYQYNGLTLHDFATYYGGAVGMLGLGLYDSVWHAKSSVQGKLQWSGELVSGILRNLWLKQEESLNNDTGTAQRLWSMALPRWGSDEEANGRFVVGGLVNNDTAGTTGNSIPISMSADWDDLGLVRRMKYALPRVSFRIGDSAEDSTPSEEYFLDTALPVIYTTLDFAANVSSLFSPPGSYENSSGLFMVDCNATAPKDLSFNIGNGYGQNISVPLYPGDLIVPMLLSNSTGGVCMSAFQNQVTVPDWRRLGWPFFRNVVLTVDVGQWMAGVSARTWPNNIAQPSSTTANMPSSAMSSSPSTPFASASSASSPTTIPSLTKAISTVHTTTAPTAAPSTLISTSTTTLPPSTLTVHTTNVVTAHSTTTQAASQGPASQSVTNGGGPLPNPDTLSISFPKTITAVATDPAVATDAFVTPPTMTTSTTTTAALGRADAMVKRTEGQARSVPDEESGTERQGDRRKARARKAQGKGARGMGWLGWLLGWRREGGEGGDQQRQDPGIGHGHRNGGGREL